MATRADITPELLRQLLRYEPETGKLFWQHRPAHFFKTDGIFKSWNSRRAGTEAFTATSTYGYRHGCVLGVDCMAHRIIWTLVYGEDAEFIDHIDGDRNNNRLANLRNVSRQENQRNMSLSRRNSSGQTGVSWSNTKKKWEVRIAGKFVGYTDDKESAVLLRKSAEKEFGFHVNHGRLACQPYQ